MRTFFAAIAIAATGLATSAIAAPCDGFTDVDSANITYCTAVTYLKDRGITLGCTGTTYCPNDYVTRLQMALFLQRMGRGGSSNVLGNASDFIGGGINNQTSDIDSAVVSGQNNSATGNAATVSGGGFNTASGVGSTVTGGLTNTASGDYSAVLGGVYSTAAGYGSIIMGTRAHATAAAQGSFVFGDSTETDVTSVSPNEFIVAASGGIRMLSDKSGTVGCSMAGGGGSWACSSSRDVKRDFSEIDLQDVLARAVALPVMRWRYMNESPEIRHIGTFSQDFRAAFGLGSNDTSITLVDAEGVSLAAIQGLNQKLEAANAKLDAQNAELRGRLEHVEAELSALSNALHADGR